MLLVHLALILVLFVLKEGIVVHFKLGFRIVNLSSHMVWLLSERGCHVSTVAIVHVLFNDLGRAGHEVRTRKGASVLGNLLSVLLQVHENAFVSEGGPGRIRGLPSLRELDDIKWAPLTSKITHVVTVLSC